MTPKQFFEAVRDMRVAQKEMFRTRNQLWITRCKELEGMVDTEIVRVDKLTKPKQGELGL